MDRGMVFGVLVVVLTCIVYCTRGEVFTALIEMEKTLQGEARVATLLEDYIASEEERLNKLRTVAADMANHSAEALRNPVRFLGNPVHAFLTVKRFTKDWDSSLSSLITSQHDKYMRDSIKQFTQGLPGEDDYSGAALALLRLQDTYKLDPRRLSHGEIPGVHDHVELSAMDCFEIGRLAYNEEDMYHTMIWMEEALNRLVEEGDQPTISKIHILDYLSYASFKQGNIIHAENITEKMLLIEPNHVRAIDNLRVIREMIAKNEDHLKSQGVRNERFLNSPDGYRSSEEFMNYEALCRGENTVKIPNAHKLTCQYRFWHPMFYIRPLKEETLSFKPWLAFYHDVLTDSEIERVKALATPRLGRATVHNPVTGKLEFAKYRISKSGWLGDDLDPVVARISQRCSAITNLTLETVEELQVVNYGIGGHYEPHFDFSRRNEPTKFESYRGNRILTLIFYMSDVEAGGATAFINAGLKVWPKKGTAAVWYNLFPNGDGDYSTRHAACPVLAGSKWVANKWFHERGQEFSRPCGLTPDSPDIFIAQ